MNIKRNSLGAIRTFVGKTITDIEDSYSKFLTLYQDQPLFKGPDKINCRGCRSDSVYRYCAVCAIKSCTIKKGYVGCHQCADFPCDEIDYFPVPEGKKNILRAIPSWKELGTEAFIEAEEKLFSCAHCGNQLFRGARKCRQCGTVKE